jgi:hypothetical protein
VTELVFADRDDLSARMAGLGADEIARDEENFIDRAATRAYVVDERSSAGRAGRQQRQQLATHSGNWRYAFARLTARATPKGG